MKYVIYGITTLMRVHLYVTTLQTAGFVKNSSPISPKYRQTVGNWFPHVACLVNGLVRNSLDIAKFWVKGFV